MQTTLEVPVDAEHRGWWQIARWRVLQFGHALRNRPDPAVDAELQRLLASDAQWQLLARLTPFDRAHHLRVHALLVRAGHDDPDLLRAALLHDVGKADERGRVGVIHRAVHVLLKRLSPALLERLARDGTWFTHGLWLSVRHAEIGGELAVRAGESDRCGALIAAHDTSATTSDPLLAALVWADNQAIR